MLHLAFREDIYMYLEKAPPIGSSEINGLLGVFTAELIVDVAKPECHLIGMNAILVM